MQPNEKKSIKRIQDYLPDRWPDLIQAEARVAGFKKGASIPTIKRVVYGIKVTHPLWPIVWKHIQKNKEMEEQVNNILKPAA